MAQHAATVIDGTMSTGWCPDCDLPSVVVDARDGSSAWAECTECGIGWTHRDDLPDRAEPQERRSVPRAA